MPLEQSDWADWGRIERLQRAGINEDVDCRSSARKHWPKQSECLRRRHAILLGERNFNSRMLSRLGLLWRKHPHHNV